MWSKVRTIDAVFVQAGIAAALSFSHIHDVAAACGQEGWQAWAYPVSVDLLLFAAWRRLRAGTGGPAEWVWFTVALVASLSANLATAGLLDGQPPVAVRLIVAGWPAVAFLGGTLLVHGRTEDSKEETVSTPVSAMATPLVDMLPELGSLADTADNSTDTVDTERTPDEDTHKPVRKSGPSAADIAAAMKDITASGRTVSGASLATHFGVSGRTGRRYLTLANA